MKNRIIPIAFLILAALVFYSCEFGLEEEIPVNNINEIVISGQVIESSTGNPARNVSVRVTDGVNQASTKTDSEGSFEVDFVLEQDKELTIITFGQGFVSDTIKVFAEKDTPLNIPLIRLNKTEQAVPNSSGKAASIYLYSQSDKSIGVKESGSNETAQIVFEVLDSVGVPITSDKAVDLYFIFGSTPGGGEYLYPALSKTNALGRASVTLNTGVIAGVTQVIAEANVDGQIIRSKPILISIHGGFPDINHFGVASEDLNYPALGIIGYEIPFTAYVGDKYSNPVRPGTSVYFETSSGIIAGSELTDNLGRSTVTLLTQPFPVHQTFGDGFFVVTASTVNENAVSINTQTLRLLSGRPHITVDPSVIDIPNGGGQTFNYTVSDANNNPIAKNNTISVKVVEGDVKVTGDIDIKLPDTQSKAYTRFTFTAYDSKPDSIKAQTAVISIESTGPNGDVKISISGISR